jgi:hypothetical protein
MISKGALGGIVAATTLSWAGAARAQPIDNAGQADAVFEEAMHLRSAGQDAAACPKFAESKRLAPGVGVTLYLADCYERTGRTASAWQEFREGEKLARERGDKRADIAAQRAAALEPKLNRLTLVAPAGEVTPETEVTLDGRRLSPESLNVALAVDPGDHVVSVASAGQPLRTLGAHVDANTPWTTLRIGPTTTPPPAVVSPAPDSAEAASTPAGTGAGARWVAGGLMVAGAVGIGIGTWLITTKTQDVMPNGQLCDPHLRPGAIPESATAFAAGGAAVLSGIILYYVNRPGRNEVSLAPAYVPGGGGAMFRGSF